MPIDQVASRRRFLQFLAASPLLAGTDFAAQQGAIVHWLERKFLAFFRNQSFDLREWRPGFGREHQFLRLVERDTAKFGKVERRIPLRGAADRALATATNHFQCFALRQRPGNRFLDLFRLVRP